MLVPVHGTYARTMHGDCPLLKTLGLCAPYGAQVRSSKHDCKENNYDYIYICICIYIYIYYHYYIIISDIIHIVHLIGRTPDT